MSGYVTSNIIPRYYRYVTGFSNREVSAPLNRINVHLAGGQIIPTQEVAQTTMDSRTKPLGLLVSLDAQKSAAGKIYWDEGDSLSPLNTGRFVVPDSMICVGSRLRQIGAFRPLRRDCIRLRHRRRSWIVSKGRAFIFYHKLNNICQITRTLTFQKIKGKNFINPTIF